MRPEKQLLLDEIREKIDSSKALMLTRYQKLEPNAPAAFRDNLRSRRQVSKSFESASC